MAQSFKDYPGDAIPFMILLDARTMEIAYAEDGARTTAEIDKQVDLITNRPPSY